MYADKKRVANETGSRRRELPAPPRRRMRRLGCRNFLAQSGLQSNANKRMSSSMHFRARCLTRARNPLLRRFLPPALPIATDAICSLLLRFRRAL